MEAEQQELECPASRVLVVDDEPLIRELLVECLEIAGLTAQAVDCGPTALKLMKTESFDLVLTDMKMPGMTGLELIRRIRDFDDDVVTIMMTGFGTVESAIEAMKLGSFDYILKPFKTEQILSLITRALREQQLSRENVALRETVGIYELSEALSSSMPLDDQLELIVATVRKQFRADCVSMVVADPEKPGTLVEKAGFGSDRVGINHHALFQEVVNGQGLVGQGDETCSWMSRPKTADHTVGAYMAVPLKMRGSPFGFLVAMSLNPSALFREGQRKGLAILGGKAANAIETARIYKNLKGTFTGTIESLQRALEAKDSYTQGHSDRVAMYSKMIAEAMNLPSMDVDRIEHGGLMHDIGKIGIRIDKLNKPQRLTPEEYELIKSHPVHGKRILEPISFLRHLVPCVYHHHEAWDGSGYPAGLEGEEIPMESRILAVADAYDAMTTDRPYRKALPHSVAMGELDRFAGKQFDVRVVKIFRQVIENNRQERIELGLIVPL